MIPSGKRPQRSGLKRALALVILATTCSAASAAELVYWSMWNQTEPQAKAITEIMAGYTKAHPETTFKVVWNGRQNQTKLRAALQAGTKVDFMDQDGDQLAGGLQAAGEGLDLTPTLDAETRKAMLPGTLELFASAGRVTSIPYIYNTASFWYSREMMKAIGGKPPATWAELLTLCAQARKANHNALVIEGNVSDYTMLYFSHLIERQLGSGALVKLFEDRSGAAWKQPAVLKAVQMSRALWDEGCIAADAKGFQYPAGQQTIALGDTLGELVGSWLPAELRDSAGPGFAWGAFNFPAVPGGVGKASDMQVHLVSMMVLKKSAHAQEAAGFAQYMLSEAAQTTMAKVGGVAVTRQGVPWPAELADAQKAASAATALSVWGGGLKVKYPEFTATVMAPEFHKVFLGDEKPETFITTLATRTKAYWEQEK